KFNPKFIQTENIEQQSDINENELDVYWNNMTIYLPVLSQI
ncbi:20548_t:CDS:2, partial [Gigaspora rosea]